MIGRACSRSVTHQAVLPSLPGRRTTKRSRATTPAMSSTEASAAPSQLAAVDLSDKAQVKAWAMVLEVAIDDMVVAGNRATQHRSCRVTSRAEARRQLFCAWTEALRLLGALQRGMR